MPTPVSPVMSTVAAADAYRNECRSSARHEDRREITGAIGRTRSGFALPALIFVWKIDTLGVAPQPFECVEAAALAAEDMDDEVEVVEQYPFGSIDAF